MTTDPAERQEHWNRVYSTKAADSVSWYRPRLEVSLGLLELAGLAPGMRVIDVGGGASTLVDDLLDRGVEDVSVLDIAAEGLAVAKRRLGERGRTVRWLATDLLLAELPADAFDLWHDRAVLHFLTEPSDAARYADQASRAVRKDGHAVIAGFAPDGPERCSGLPVARRSAGEIAGVLGSSWTLVEQRAEQHATPGGTLQSFVYALLRHA